MFRIAEVMLRIAEVMPRIAGAMLRIAEVMLNSAQKVILRIAEVIAIAAENSKPLALLGALRTGAIDVIATSVSNALTVLNLDEQMHGNSTSEV